MAPDRCCRRARSLARVTSLVAPWLALAALPKCPLCLAAALSVFGVSVGGAATCLRVLAPALAVTAVVALALAIARRARAA